MSEFRLTLKESASRHMMERETRYDVLLNGKKIDELYFNMTGYRGALMSISGSRIDIGEKGISAWKREVSAINSEAKTILRENLKDPARIERAERTVDGNVRRLTFDDGLVMHVENREYIAAVELMGANRVGPAFFSDLGKYPELNPGAILRGGEKWIDARFTLGIFETSDPDQVAVAVGSVPKLCADLISHSKTGIIPGDWHQDVRVDAVRDNTGEMQSPLPDDWDLDDLKDLFPDDWGNGVSRIVFLDRLEVDDIIQANGGEFMHADCLPGWGRMSESSKVFIPMITSTGQRPEILMDLDDVEIFEETARRSGYNVVLQQDDPVESPAP